MPIRDDDPTRQLELAAVAQWLDWARREGILTGDPLAMISDLEQRWERVYTEAVTPEVGIALLEARRSGALPEGVLYAHIVGLSEYDDPQIARELLRWLERAAELSGSEGLSETAEHAELGVRSRRQLAYTEPVLALLPPTRGGALFRGQYRGVPSDRKGRAVLDPKSGVVHAPDDPRWQAEVRRIDAAMRKGRGRAEARRRERIAREKRAGTVTVTTGPTGTVSAGPRRRRKRNQRKR